MKCKCGSVVLRQNSFHCDQCGGDNSLPDIDSVKRSVARTVELLTCQLDWDNGVESLHQALQTTHQLCPPLLETFSLQISVWKAIWMLCGNKRLSKLF